LLAERHGGTPWHRHHIVERHNLFVLIALGDTATTRRPSPQRAYGA